VSTLAYLLLFMALRSGLGAQAANLVALLLTAIANTAANRRFTFGIAGTGNVTRHHLEGLTVFAIALTITSGSLGLLHVLIPAPHPAVELGVLVAANLAATVARFVLLRGWVFHPSRTRRADTSTKGPTP
jgi:putative flippase GtrA